MKGTPARLLQLAGIFAIGDGALSVAAPRSHTSLWHVGPRPWRRSMARLHRQPRLTRALGLGELALGILLVSFALRR